MLLSVERQPGNLTTLSKRLLQSTTVALLLQCMKKKKELKSDENMKKLERKIKNVKIESGTVTLPFVGLYA